MSHGEGAPTSIRSATSDGGQRTRTEALIHLLGDESSKVRDAAWAELLRLGRAVADELRAAAESSPESTVRLRSRALLLESRRREVLGEWVDLCYSPGVDLEQGAFVIARSEDPDADVDGARRVLDRGAVVLRRRLETARTTEAAVEALAGFVHSELGLRGDRESYYDPDNSYLPRVLERRRGIPISLATVYLCLARRLGIPLEGVGMPRHFLLKFAVTQGGLRRERFVDPFRDGRLLSARDCARLLEENGVPFHESFLRAVTDREILQRALGNLLRNHHEAGDSVREARVAAMIQVLQRSARV